MNAFSVLCRTEGIIPAIESAHALAGALDIGRELGPDGLILVNLSGRGDKDVDTASTVVRGVTHVASVSGTARAFGKAAAENRAALVGYLPAGFPSVAGAIEAAPGHGAGRRRRHRGGPAVLRPADGRPGDRRRPCTRALAAGTRVADVLRTVEAVAAAGVPVLVMTYWNPVDRYGVRAFARDLAAAGGSGLITPDLTLEEAGSWLDASDEYDLDRVFLVAPSSTDERRGQDRPRPAAASSTRPR